MLDVFEIVTTSGLVVYRRQYAPIPSNLVNSFINDVFIEERGQKPGDGSADQNTPYKKDKYTLRWTMAKDVGLICVAVYQSLFHMNWIDELLDAIKSLFIQNYPLELKSRLYTKINGSWFDPTFNVVVQKLDNGSIQRRVAPSSSTTSDGKEVAEYGAGSSLVILPPGMRRTAASQPVEDAVVVDDTTSADVTPIATPDTSRPGTPSQQPSSGLLQGKAASERLSRRAKKANASGLVSSTPASSGDESQGRRQKGGKNSVKQKRRWDADGSFIDGDDDAVLDYSASDITSAPNESENDLDIDDVKAEQMGSRTRKGEFVLKDLDDEVDAVLSAQSKSKSTALTIPTATTSSESSGLLGSASSKISGLFRNVVGGKTLTKADLQQPLQQMQTHLLEKNVAREAAERLCSSVEKDLLDQKTASFTSIDTTIRESMSKALTRMLTPTSSLDLLRNINSTIDGPEGRPYVISIVGVNGVGKSTNLSKIAYFLLQNHYRVLVVAADTFRSGAVEQLRVHVRNLGELSQREQVGTVELFEKGYGKDAATVARDAVATAGKGADRKFDIVLIDTAGRRHNDTRLMSSLTKFGQLANPDKIFMVGEALVGTDSVAQARNFAKEFVDSKGQLRNNGVGMDGFIISKCDTVGDMVGTLVSMVHATGIPVVFLGVGQHYGDLRGLNVGWAVDKLMR